MIAHKRFATLLFLGLALTTQACAPQKPFYWGSYEDGLFTRVQHAGQGGETEAVALLVRTISDASLVGTQKIGPGIHADYGYLLFKQGKVDEAIFELEKEASLYPEARPLMDTMISRMQMRRDKEKKSAP